MLEKGVRRHGFHSEEELCGRILQRHRDRIRTKKPHLAVANLSRIVAAILKLSNRNGFHATSLRDLARETGLSMGGLYSYFDSKDTLLMMILGEVSTTVTETLDDVPGEVAADPLLHLRWLIETHVLLTEAMLPWFVFAYMEAKSFPPSARKAAVDSEAATERIFSDVLRRGLERGSFAGIDPELAAALVKPLLQDWYVKRAKWRKRGVTAEAYARHVTGFVEAAIGAKDRNS